MLTSTASILWDKNQVLAFVERVDILHSHVRGRIYHHVEEAISNSIMNFNLLMNKRSS